MGHVSLAHPICKGLLGVLRQACETNQITYHMGGAAEARVWMSICCTNRPLFNFPGTYINMEGPAFSTYAESQLYRSWGAHVRWHCNWMVPMIIFA